MADRLEEWEALAFILDCLKPAAAPVDSWPTHSYVPTSSLSFGTLVSLCSAFVMPGTLQATYTGAQLRAAATMYALMVDGLFGPANWQAVKTKARLDIARRAVKRGFASARRQPDGERAAASGRATPSEDGAPAAAAESSFDWEPYFQRFGDIKPQDAMTSMMVAFGRLMNDFSGYNQPSTPPTRTERAARVRQQAQDFVLGMVEPLFGTKRSSKLHELLCHAADEIELREDFSMADTSPNERKHKEEKAAYRRTNRHTASAGRQLLTVAQARILLQEEEARLMADKLLGMEVSPGGRADPSDVSSQESEEDGDASSSDDECATEAAMPLGRSFRGVRVPVEHLVKRPGLGALGGLVGVPSYAEVPVLTSIHFMARYEWGALPCVALLRSSPAFYGAPWYDSVIFRRHVDDAPQFGMVLLIVVGGLADCAEPCAVVQCMEPAEPIPGAPLAAAGYQRLRWSFDSEAAEWPTLIIVPLSGVQRIVHIVPDVQLLAPSGLVAPPAAKEGAETDGLRSQFFLNNILFKSTTPAQQRIQRLRTAKSGAAGR